MRLLSSLLSALDRAILPADVREAPLPVSARDTNNQPDDGATHSPVASDIGFVHKPAEIRARPRTDFVRGFITA